MITGSEIVKDFDGVKALDGVNFTVETGSVYGLVGPNGSGKSTLIRHIMGIFKQDAGELKIDDEPVYENKNIKEKMAYVPDEIYYNNGSNLKNMAQLYKAVYPKFEDERLKRLTGLFDKLDDKLLFRKMSKGMQKQASVLLAISACPEILILDEPMDGLDPMARHTVWKIIMESVATDGTTVLVSSHNLRELEDVCDHIGIMNHGKIIMEKSYDDLQEGFAKVTIAYQEEGELPEFGEGLKILHQASQGRMHTLILEGEREVLETRIRETAPVFTEFMPLTLEEIFINELGGENDAIKDILL